MSKGKLWTAEEERVVLNAVKDNPGNLRQAFEAASQVIDRSPKSITNRWYKNISKRTDKDSIALVCMSGKTFGVNRKNCKTELTEESTTIFGRMWNRITNFFSGND